MRLFFVVLFMSISRYVLSVEDCSRFRNICNEEASHTCAQCIDAHYCCVWIYDENINVPRCSIEDDIPDGVVSIIYGGKSKFEVVKNEEFSVSSPMEDEPAIQIRPQKITAYLRRGDPISFNLTYKAAPDYALDIYFLMDLTYSMLPYKENLSKLGIKLAEKLKAMTSNYKIAFGFYSDKVLSPYYKMDDKNVKNPCQEKDIVCEPGFNFKHAFNFSQDLEKFAQQVTASEHTANFDDYEAGLDALMQIMLCQRELEWRRYSRKIVLIATDALLHVAGDGKLAGVVSKVSDVCKLIPEKNYNVYKGLSNDYPSVEEIYRRLLKYKMNVLFAVSAPVQKYYEALKNILEGVAYIGILKEDPENVLSLVEKGYMELSRRVYFSSKENENVKVWFASNCNTNTFLETSTCDNIAVGKEYTFTVNLELDQFPSDRSANGNIIIEEMNIEEILEVDVVYLGSHCDCEGVREGEKVAHGKYECGKFVCDDGWTGDTCSVECDHTKGRFENETYTSTTCNSRGDFDMDTCKCVCYENYIGEYCQHRQCPRNRLGKICSDHGTCNQGTCVCNEWYSGKDCDCYLGSDTCFPHSKAIICSGHGDCICGKCVCNSTQSILYKGQFCEKCKGCENLCDVYKEDIIAMVDGRGKEKGKFDQYEITEVDDFWENDDFSKCLAIFYEKDDMCSIEYTYEILSNGRIKIDFKRYCQTLMKAGTVLSITTAGVVLALVCVLLTWRVIVYMKDKKEYLAHLENRRETSFNEGNPLYKSPYTYYELGDLKHRTSFD